MCYTRNSTCRILVSIYLSTLSAGQTSKNFRFANGFSTQGHPGLKLSHHMDCLFPWEMRYRKSHTQLIQIVDRIILIDCNEWHLASPKIAICSRSLCFLEFPLQKHQVPVSKTSYISVINILEIFPFE